MPKRPEASPDPYTRTVGPDAEATFAAALAGAGCSSRGPDSAGEFSSQCPAHPDKVASLRWRPSVDGRVLFDCHAGCTGDEIIKALGIRWHQTRPVRTEFDYFTPDGTYSFTVVREHSADGSKVFWQGVRADGGTGQIAKGREDVPDQLWRAPELTEWAAGVKGGTLWLVEGEKDARILGASLEIEGRSSEYATSAPGGANRWSADLTRAVAALAKNGGISRVVVLCDRDGAGIRRGVALVPELSGALGDDVAVSVMAPREGTGKDVGEVIDRYGVAGWEARIESVEESDLILEGVDGSLVTGQLTRVIEPSSGKSVLAAGVGGKEPRPVISGDLEVRAWWTHDPESDVPSGWEVEVVPLVGRRRRVVLEVGDLSDPRRLRKWLIEKAGLTRTGVGIGDFGDALVAWLRWQTELTRAPQVVAAASVGWVDVLTGRPASVASEQMLWVDESGRALAGVGVAVEEVGVRYTGGKAVHAAWGLESDDRACRWAFARALTFADPQVVGVTAGWAAATVLGPWLARAGVPIRPGLAVIAPSGSGKTNGAVGLLLQLAGCTGPVTSTRAAFRRLLQSGVGTVRWLDDSDLVEDAGMKELLRVATTRSDHVLANADGGATATEGAELTGSPVVSAEGVRWLEETAMVDRFALVQPANPQTRTSTVPGREGAPQWDDVTELTEEWANGQGGLSRLAGWFVRGVVEAAELEGEGSVELGVRRWLAAAGGTRGRKGAVEAAVETGTRAVASWLTEGASGDGRKWPGKKLDGRYATWGWLLEGVDAWRANAVNATASVSCSLVDIVLPRLIAEDAGAVRISNRTAFLVTGIDATGLDEMVKSLGKALGMGSAEMPMPALIIDTEGRYWVASRIASLSYQKAVGRAGGGGGEVRLVSDQAIADQVLRLADDPEWAFWNSGVDKGGHPKKRFGARLGGRDRRVVYRRLSELACERVQYLAEG